MNYLDKWAKQLHQFIKTLSVSLGFCRTQVQTEVQADQF